MLRKLGKKPVKNLKVIFVQPKPKLYIMNDVFKIKFSKEKDAEFVKELKLRVNNYFKEKGITRFANPAMVVKTIMMFSILLIPYSLLVFGVVTNIWIAMLCWMGIGLGVAGIGMSVMHDANHGAYSKHKFVNKFLGRTIDLVGGNATNWKIQHNLLHHTFTNLNEIDGDIDAGALMRFNKDQKRYGFHRFQHIYAWALYGVMTIQWMTYKDFFQMLRFRKENLDKSVKRTFWKEYSIMVFAKMFYYTYMVVIPLIVLPFAWWQIILGIVLMQFTSGFTLATTFQLAHVMPSTVFPELSENLEMEENWVVHQLKTTSDFAQNSKLISWYVGGLNFQVEHHIFPNICHIHYKKIAKIVEETANDYNIVYNKIPTMFGALAEHGKLLKDLGKKELATV
jgi:linoleoyl-CoA desaturase